MSERGPDSPGDPTKIDPSMMPDRPDDTKGLYEGATGVEELDLVDTPESIADLADPMDTVDAPLDAEPAPDSPERTRGRALIGAVGAVALGAVQGGREMAGRFAGHAKRYKDAGKNFAQEKGRQAKEKAGQKKESIQTKAKERAQRRYEKDFKDQVGNLADRRLTDAKEAKLVRDRDAVAHHMGALVGHTLLVEPTEGRVLRIASRFGLAPTEQERREAVIAKYQAELDAAPGAPDARSLYGPVGAAVEALKKGDTAEYDKQMKIFERDIAYNKNVAYALSDKEEKFVRERAAQFIQEERDRQTAAAEAAAAVEAAKEAQRQEKAAKHEARVAQIADWEDPAQVLHIKKAIAEELASTHPGLLPDNPQTKEELEAVRAATEKYTQDYFGRSTEELEDDLTTRGRGHVPGRTQTRVAELLNMSMTDLKQEVAKKETGKEAVVIEVEKKVDGKVVKEKKTMPVKGPAIHRGVLLDTPEEEADTAPDTDTDIPDNVTDLDERRRLQQMLEELQGRQQLRGNGRQGRPYFGPGSSFGFTGASERRPLDSDSIVARRLERQEEARASIVTRQENEARRRRNAARERRNEVRRARGEPEEPLEGLAPHPDVARAAATATITRQRKRETTSPNPKVRPAPQTTGRAAGRGRLNPRRYTGRSSSRQDAA